MARAHRVENRIREIRKAKGMTQEQLGDRVGVHFTTIAKIERAERGLSMDMLAALSRALGVTPIEIIGNRSAASPMRMVPLLGEIAPGNWRDALSDPDGTVPVPNASASAFAVVPAAGSMDLVVGTEAVVVVDPEDLELRDNKVYAILNGAGVSMFKRFSIDPMRLVPVSSAADQKPILIGQEPFTIIGRVTWQISSL